MFPYRSGVGQIRLNPSVAITEGWMIFWIDSICLSLSEDANKE